MIRKRFLNDVKNHEMRVMHDDGVYRHVVFKKPNSCINQFNLTTFPGRLVISGDMGTYVFARLPDMFTFFPSFRDNKNFSYEYYAEKCEAQDKYCEINKEEGSGEFTYHYMWAINAICWGIDKYNEFKEGADGKD